jgi:hypothetical protein
MEAPFIFEGLVFASYHSALVRYVVLSPALPMALSSATNDSLIPIHMNFRYLAEKNFFFRDTVECSVILANRLRCRCFAPVKYASHILNDLL